MEPFAEGNEPPLILIIVVVVVVVAAAAAAAVVVVVVTGWLAGRLAGRTEFQFFMNFFLVPKMA